MSDIVVGLMMAVFGIIGLFLVAGAADSEMYIFGLSLALGFRLACLLALTSLIGLTRPVIEVFGRGLSWRDMVLIVAGLFLIGQATLEIHQSIDGEAEDETPRQRPQALGLVVLNIAAMDLVFSFDSILTAIGIARDLAIMVIAILISLVIMFAAATAVAGFIRSHPTTKVLALCFLVLIGLSLLAEGSGLELPRGYLYFAMMFSGGVEMLNIWAKRNRQRRRARQR